MVTVALGNAAPRIAGDQTKCSVPEPLPVGPAEELQITVGEPAGTVTESTRMPGKSKPAVSRLISELKSEIGQVFNKARITRKMQYGSRTWIP